MHAQWEPRLTFTVEDFEFAERIGTGKFGQVFRAVERRTKKVVAIKQVRKDLLKKYNFFGQMKKETEIQWRLSQEHPNIAKLHCFFYDSEHIYCVMEYAPHGNLY